MKKLLSKILFLIFVFAIIVPNVFAITNSKSTQNDNSIIAVEDLFENEEWQHDFELFLAQELGDNYKEIIDSNWNSAVTAENIRNLFTKSRSGETIYPEYIGGLYINDGNNLVVQIVDDYLPEKKDYNYNTYNKILTMSDNLIVENVQYPLNELNTIIQFLENYYKTNYSYETYAIYNNVLASVSNFTLGENVESFYIDEAKNRVVVKLYKNTLSEIEKFKDTVVNSQAIIFEQADKLVDEHNPGGPLPATNTCSLGYRARISSNTSIVGIMTAGHCSQTGGEVGTVIVNSNGSLFGTIWSWQQSGSIDAAFIATLGQTLTNTLNKNSSNTGTGPTLSTTVASSFTAGQWVGKVGISTGYTVGKVVSPSATVAGFTNLVTATYDSSSGDSGSIVFSGSTSNYITAGIHKGRTGSNALFSKASVINSAFGISRY